MKRLLIVAIMTAACSRLQAQYDVSMQKILGYNPTGSLAWGTVWDSAIVMKNQLITLGTVPRIGGRTMQFDLGTHPSMLVASTYVNQTPTSYQSMGGFVTIASPQSSFTWGPPASFTQSAYTPTIVKNNADTCSLYLEGPMESMTSTQTNLRGLAFKRTLTIFKASTRVNIAITLLNKGTSTTLPGHGIWDITENSCSHPGINADSMYWVYVPLNPASTLGSGKKFTHLTQYVSSVDTTEEVLNAGGTDILGIRYRGTKESLVGADSKAGWLAFVDRRDGYAYVKMCPYQEGRSYPDNVSISVYTSTATSAASSFFEVEFKGPMTTLAPGDSTTLVIDLYATRCPGPVAWACSSGLISRHLIGQVSGDSTIVKGSFGVFYPGYVKSFFKDNTGTALAGGDSIAVTPLDSLLLNKRLKTPAGAAKLFLAAYTSSGAVVGYLDSATLSTAVRPEQLRTLQKAATRVALRNGSIEIAAAISGSYAIELTLLNGKRIASFTGYKPQNFTVPANHAPAGVYLMKTLCAGAVSVQKVCVGR